MTSGKKGAQVPPLCVTHLGHDTNGDGDCWVYSTATPETKAALKPCVFKRGTGSPGSIEGEATSVGDK